MKKKMKKIMALAAALVMCLGILTVPAAASDTTLEFDDYVYTGQIGDTVYLNATYVGEQNPADLPGNVVRKEPLHSVEPARWGLM